MSNYRSNQQPRYAKPSAPIQRGSRRPTTQKKYVTVDQLSRYVKNTVINQADQKYYYTDSGLVAVPFTVAGTLLNLGFIQQGTADTERVGDSVRLQSINILLRIVVSGTSPDVYRVIVWRYKSAQTALATDPIRNAGGLDYQSCMSPIDPKRTQEIVVLRDLYKQISTVGENINAIRMSIDLKNVQQTYNSTNTLCTNNIYVSLFAEGIPTNNYVYSSQLRFTDS